MDLLTSPRGLAALDGEAAAPDAGDPFARSAALRRAGFSASETAALLTQADLRRRAAAKFGPFAQRMLFTAFDHGITHFDLANNYGPPPGAAEERVGRIIRQDMAGYRDELIIGTKAGFSMWPGPYGQYGSRKSLLASLDQSLRRLGMDYVDIFYAHRFEYVYVR